MVGRPKGSRNRAGHKPGGYRSNAGNISNDERKRRDEEEKAQKKRQEERRAQQQEAERERRISSINSRETAHVTTPFSAMHDSCNDESKSDTIEGGPDEDIDEDVLIYDEYDGIEIDEDDKYAPRNRHKSMIYFTSFRNCPWE